MTGAAAAASLAGTPPAIGAATASLLCLLPACGAELAVAGGTHSSLGRLVLTGRICSY